MRRGECLVALAACLLVSTCLMPQDLSLSNILLSDYLYACSTKEGAGVIPLSFVQDQRLLLSTFVNLSHRLNLTYWARSVNVPHRLNLTY